jgi:hypothetical protein
MFALDGNACNKSMNVFFSADGNFSHRESKMILVSGGNCLFISSIVGKLALLKS